MDFPVCHHDGTVAAQARSLSAGLMLTAALREAECRAQQHIDNHQDDCPTCMEERFSQKLIDEDRPDAQLQKAIAILSSSFHRFRLMRVILLRERDEDHT